MTTAPSLYNAIAELLASSARVEAKLDLLLSMLAEDAQDESQARALDGSYIPRDRDENAPL